MDSSGIRLVYKRGGVTCNTQYAKTKFGCRYPSSANKISVFITNTQNKKLFPYEGNVKGYYRGFYDLPPYYSNNDEIILPGEGLITGTNLRLWYGNALDYAKYDDNNAGETCVDVFIKRKNKDNPLKNSVLKKDNLIIQRVEIPLEYSISFELYPNVIHNEWRSILHFTQGDDNNKLGSRIPSVMAHGNQKGSLQICCNFNGDLSKMGRCVDSEPIKEKQWNQIKVSQRRLLTSLYVYQVEVNGIVELQEFNKMPQLFKDVKVYASDPWYEAQDGSIKALAVRTDSWELVGSNVCFGARRNSFGRITLPFDIDSSGIRLVYKRGGVTCKGGYVTTKFGCRFSSLYDKISVYITDENNKKLFPNDGNVGNYYGGYYTLNSYRFYTDDIVLPGRAQLSGTYRLWYGEALDKSSWASNNAGHTCVDVFAKRVFQRAESKNDFSVPNKVELLLEEDMVLRRSHLITQLAEIPLEYSISFELYPNVLHSDSRSILHFTQGDNNNRLGSRIPALMTYRSPRGAISICSNINGEKGLNGRCTISKPLGVKQWNRIKISQIKNENGEYIYQVAVNRIIEHEEVNQMPQLFKDVKIYASDPWYTAQDGIIRKLIFKTEYEMKNAVPGPKQNELLLEEDTVIRRNNLITQLAELPLEYRISFELYANVLNAGSKSILHFTQGDDNNKIGSRIPAISTNSRGSIQICCNNNGDTSRMGRCVDTKPVTVKEWSRFKVSQIKNENGEYVYQVEVNGVVEHEEVNIMPQLFKNVKVYASDPWYDAYDGSIRNLNVKTEFWELVQSNVCFGAATNFGRIKLRFGIKAGGIRLVYKSGGVTCNPEYTKTKFGCKWPEVATKISVFITDKDDTKLFPNKVQGYYQGFYDLEPYNADSDEIILPGKAVEKGADLRLWYGESLDVPRSRIGNEGETCVDVYAKKLKEKLEPKNEISVPKKIESLLGGDTVPKRDNLIKQLAEIPLEYSISFELYPNVLHSDSRSILHFTQGDDNNKIGSRIPALWSHETKRGSIHICSHFNGDVSKMGRCIDSKPIRVRQWNQFELSQVKNEHGEYVYQVNVNGYVELIEVNKMPQLFKDVKVYASDPWYNSQDGILRNLVLKTEFEPKEGIVMPKEQEVSFKQYIVPEKDNIIKQLTEIPLEYSISFELYPNVLHSDSRSILHFTQGDDNNRLGSRIPAIWSNKEKIGSIHICCNVNGDVSKMGRCIDSKPITEKQWNRFKISQIKNENGEYVYQVKVNGVVEHEEVNKVPQLFKNVKVYASDPWYDAQDGVIRNLVLKTSDFKSEVEEKPQQPEEDKEAEKPTDLVKEPTEEEIEPPVLPKKPVEPVPVEPNDKEVGEGYLPYNVYEIASTGTVEYKTSVDCVVVVKDSDSGRLMEMDETRCPLKPSLQFFLKRFFEHRGGKDLDALTMGFVQPENMNFKQMHFEKGFVNFKAAFAGGHYKHTQTMIALTQVQLNALRVSTKNEMLHLETVAFEVEGEHSKLGKCLLKHQTGRSDVLIDIAPKTVTIDDFIANWYLTLQELELSKVDFDFNKFRGATGAQTSIKGVYSKDEGMQLVMASRANNGDVFTEHGATLRFLVFKRPNKPTNAALLVEYEPTVKIKEQLKLFTSYQFSSPQFVKDQPQKWVLSSAKTNVYLIQNQQYLSVYGDIIQKIIHKGVNVYMKTNMKEALKKCDQQSTASLTAGLPDDGMVLVRMHLGTSGVVTFLPPSMKADVFAMLQCIQPGTVKLPDFLFSVTKRLNFKITELVVAPAENKYILTVESLKEIAIFGSLKMTAAKISIVKHGVDPLIVTANSKIKFGSITADVTLSVNSDKEVNFLLGIPFMDVDSFFKALGVNVFGNPITGAFKSFLNFGVKNFALSIIYTHGDMANARIVASGAPIIPGLTKGHIKLVAMVYNPTADEEDEEEKRSARLPANTGTAPASTRGNQATVPSHQATVPSHQATLSNHQATGMKRSSSRAVTFGIIYPYTRLDRILKDIGFNVHAPWLGEASIIVLASNARKVRCSDPETGKSRICQRSKPVSDIKPEGSKDSSSTRGTERLKNTEEHKHEHEHEHEEEKEEGEEEEEEEEESDEDKEEGTQKTLFEDIAEISDMVVAEGLTVRALMKLPSSCQGDMMCKWMQNTLGKNLALQLDATFTITQISLTAMIQMKVALGDLGYMTGFRFELRVGIINSVGVGFNLYIKDIPATITADITLSVGKLELRGTMAGMVLQPFGLKFFAFGDLLLSIGITFAAGLPSFELGAQIWFGGFKDGKDTADTLKFRGYVGIDPSNPNENYFFFESLGADLTIGNVLRALGASKLKLPKLLDESGLYGFLFSLNLGSEDKEIAEFGLVFPPGLRIEGLLNVLGFKIDFKLRFSPEEGSLYLKAEFDPIGDWASGLITFVRSAKEREKGPFLLVDIAPQEAKYVIHIEGLVGLMGRDYYVMVKIHDNGLEFSVGASLFNVLHAHITVKFSYLGGKIGDFAFRGCLAFDLWSSKLVSTLADKLELDKIKEAITAVFDHAKKIADAAFKVAKQAVSWAKSKIQAVRNTINSMRSGISSYQDRLRRRSREIEKEKKALVYSCKSRCGDVCVPFFGWKRKCWKGWWSWHGCVTIDRCKWRVPNLICIAGCEIGKGIQKMFLYIEQLAVKVLLGLTTVADKLLEGVTALSYLGDKVLDVSNHLLDFANKATKALLDLPKYLGKLIVINNFCVYGNFDPNDQSCVGIHVDVTLIGARFQFEGSLCLDTNIFGNIGKAAAAKKVPEVAKIENDVSEIHTQKDSLKVKVAQMEKEKASTESGVNSETGKSYKRSLVPTQEELIIHEAAFGRIPNHDLRNAQSVGAIQRPWLDSFDMDEYKSEMQRKRSFPRHHLSQEDESKPCKLEQTTLDRYSKIIDSYHAVVKQTENTEQDYLRLKRSHLNHIDNINKQIQEGLSKYNMTMEEKAELAFWRDTVEHNYESYAKKADEFLKERKRDNIIVARHDLDSMLVTERGMDLPAYMNHLQELRSRSSKKSSIERDTVDKVHEQLYAVVTKDLPYREVAKHLDNARNALSTAKRSSIPCAA